MYHLIEFLRSLMNNQTIGNTFLETSQWSFIQKLSNTKFAEAVCLPHQKQD